MAKVRALVACSDLILNRPSVVSCEADLCGETEGAGAEEVLMRGMGIAPRRRRPQGLA